MSFSSLRAKRQSERPKSYVAAAKPSETEATITLDPNNDEQQSSSMTGLLDDLPPFLEVRSSAESGRGLWTNSVLKRGAWRSGKVSVWCAPYGSIPRDGRALPKPPCPRPVYP